MINLEILENGNLKATLKTEDRAEFIDTVEQYDHDGAFIEGTEDFWTNGWCVYASNSIAMFTGIIICDDASIDDEGNPELYGKTWANMNGQISSASQDLIDFGECIFTQVTEG